MASKLIYVYADWNEPDQPLLIGTLRAESLRGNEVFSFEYASSWLKENTAMVLDPDLYWYSGPQYLPEEKLNFGLFLDSSPDRWGRVLMRRREAVLARLEERPQRTLLPSDYLLGVYDEHRMGALRFKEDQEESFMNDNREMATPPWTTLRDLEYASLQLEKDDSVDNPDYLHWLNLLTAPGSSLGGARPKAGILDQHEHLWIAKFPSLNDSIDMGGWEMVVYDLAIQSGIHMSESKVEHFSSRQYTFLTKRFDRTDQRKRIHFASAMTLLGCKDGDDYHSGISYLDLVGFIQQQGDKNRVDSDLEQLWRRIVFSICVKNTDDHLRNHGFLLGSNGWQLSPAYDLNAVPTGHGLTLNISDEDNSLSLKLALSVVDFFRVDKEKAQSIIDHIQNVVATWRSGATKYELSRAEQEMMALAFEGKR